MEPSARRGDSSDAPEAPDASDFYGSLESLLTSLGRAGSDGEAVARGSRSTAQEIDAATPLMHSATTGDEPLTPRNGDPDSVLPFEPQQPPPRGSWVLSKPSVQQESMPPFQNLIERRSNAAVDSTETPAPRLILPYR